VEYDGNGRREKAMRENLRLGEEQDDLLVSRLHWTPYSDRLAVLLMSMDSNNVLMGLIRS